MSPTHRHRPTATPTIRPPRRHRRHPELEGLEERVVLSATIYTVNAITDIGAGSGTTGDLRYAIEQADANSKNSAGSIIKFDPTVFASPQQITLSKGLGTLDLTEAAGPVVIEGPTAGVTVSGGGAVAVFSVSAGVTASLSGMVVTGGSGSYGGIENRGALTLDGCTISGNTAGGTGSGGGLWSDGTATLAGCDVAGNSAAGGGGGLENHSGTLTLFGCTISGNSAGGDGGGIDNSGALTLISCTVSGDSASGRGGGLSSDTTAAVALTGCTVAGDSAGSAGGGLSGKSGTMTLTGCTVSGDRGQTGGGFYLSGATATMNDCTVSGDSASGQGGGLQNLGTLTLDDCTVSGNTAASGGGLFDSGAVSGFGGATLTDTIIAGNIGGGTPGDISVNNGGSVSGSYDLIGTGGSGGIAGGTDGNIVLTSLADLGLAPLGSYGGPTQTMALLPGSRAIGAGTGLAGITTDQRGIVRPSSGVADIGAFESRGFKIAVAGGNNQVALPGAAFPLPLQVAVSSAYGEPVQGGVVTFAAPGSGPSAALSAGTAAIGSGGVASVTATANATLGTYGVTATASGAAPASFAMTNVSSYQPAFSGLTDQTITYGTASVTLAGKLADVSQAPAGDDVTITLDGVAQVAKIGSDGSFSTTFDTAALGVVGSPYTVSYAYAAEGPFLGNGATSRLTVDPAPLTITAISDSKTYDGTTSNRATPTYQVAGLPANTLFNGDRFTTLGQAFASKDVLGPSHGTLQVFYAIDDGDGGRDYAVTTQTAPGTINPAPLTITAESLTMPFGGPMPVLTASYAGLVDGETPAVLTAPVRLSTTATGDSPSGTYPITATGAAATDYAIRYVAGTMTVASPVSPTQPRPRAAEAFLTTLYDEVLGRGPRPSELRYWTRRWVAGAPTRTILRALSQSPERLTLDQGGRAPDIPLGRAYADAMRAMRRARRPAATVPGGPLSLSRPGRVRQGINGDGLARPRGSGRA